MALLTALVLVGSANVPALAQPEAVELRFKLARGETLYYNRSASVRGSFEMLGKRQASEARTEGRLVSRVLDVDSDGTMLVETVLEDARTTSEGTTKPEILGPALTKITPSGRIVEQQMGQAEFLDPEDLPSDLPDRPVKVGESWGDELSKTVEKVTVQMHFTSTLTSVEPTADGLIAHIRTEMSGRVTNFDLEPPPGVRVNVGGTIRGSAEQAWSVDRGRPLNGTLQLDGDIRMEASGPAGTVNGRFTMTVASQSEPLSENSIVVPTVEADALVVPGKTIGAVALNQSAADLETTLGTPQPAADAHDPTMWGADRGFRCNAVTWWPSGLVAYLDSADPASVLGLGIAAPRYRTDKGLGFGSSQGAVLFAYGMSPMRVDMSSGDGSGGAVRVLVYNDQGVAFAITTNKGHGYLKMPHAPVGAVDWMVVFPPGAAGKIFPLP